MNTINVSLPSLQLFNKYVTFATVVILQAHNSYMWDVESRRSQVRTTAPWMAACAACCDIHVSSTEDSYMLNFL